MRTAPECFLYMVMHIIAGVSGSSFTCFLSCGNLLSEADDPMAVSDVEAGVWPSAAAARLPFLLVFGPSPESDTDKGMLVNGSK